MQNRTSPVGAERGSKSTDRRADLQESSEGKTKDTSATNVIAKHLLPLHSPIRQANGSVRMKNRNSANGAERGSKSTSRRADLQESSEGKKTKDTSATNVIAKHLLP